MDNANKVLVPCRSTIFANVGYGEHYKLFNNPHDREAQRKAVIRTTETHKYLGTDLTEEQRDAVISALNILLRTFNADLSGTMRLTLQNELLNLVDNSDPLLIANGELAQKQHELQQLMERRQQAANPKPSFGGFMPQAPSNLQAGNLPPWAK